MPYHGLGAARHRDDIDDVSLYSEPNKPISCHILPLPSPLTTLCDSVRELAGEQIDGLEITVNSKPIFASMHSEIKQRLNACGTNATTPLSRSRPVTKACRTSCVGWKLENT